MVHKKMLSVLVVGTMLCCALPVNAAAVSEAETVGLDPLREVNPAFEELVLENPTTADETGNITLSTDGSLIDFYFPTELSGEAITKITENAFRSCPYFRTVLIDSSMEEIGANAFADCEGLEYIVLLDRADTEDLNLGENWSGDATVIFELVAEESEAPAEGGTTEGKPAGEVTQTPAEPVVPEQTEATEDSEVPTEPSETPVQSEQSNGQQAPGNEGATDQPDAMKPEDENGDQSPSEPSEPDPDAGEVPETPAAGNEESEDALPSEDEPIKPEVPETEGAPENGDGTNEDNSETEPPAESEIPENPEAPVEPSESPSQNDTSSDIQQTPDDELTESPDSSEPDGEPEPEVEQTDRDDLLAYVDELVSFAKEALPEYAEVIDQVYEKLDIEAILDSELFASVDADVMSALVSEIESTIEANGGIENCMDILVSFAKEALPEYADVIDQVYEELNVEEIISTMLDLLADESVRDSILTEFNSFIEENGGIGNCVNMLVSFAKEAMPEYAEFIDLIYENLDIDELNFSDWLDLLADESVRDFVLTEINSFIEENGGIENCLKMLVSFSKTV